MKKATLSALTVIALTSAGFAGGDVEPAMIPAPEGAVDQSAFYVGLGLSAVSARDAGLSMDFFDSAVGQDRLGNLTFQAGYEFNKYIGVEGRYATSIAYEDVVEMNGWSLFVKPQYPVTEAFDIYALIGYGGVQLEPASFASVDVDDSGFQWGLGLSYDVTQSVSVFFDYTSLAYDMEGLYHNGALTVDTDALTLGVSYRF